MGLLDGDIAALFGSTFGAIYPDGQLVTALTQPVYDGQGNITGYSGDDPVAIKVQRDACTYAMQQSDGYVDGDVRLIVLAQGLPSITTDHRITDHTGKEWMVQSADLDAASSHWICRGRAA